MKEKIGDGSTLSMVSAYFTIYAFEALKDYLAGINSLNFLFGEPRFIKSLDPSQTDKLRWKEVSLSRRLSNLYSQAYAGEFMTSVSLLRGDWQAMQSQAEEQIAFCREHELPHLRALATFDHGYAIVRQGTIEEGIATMEKGLRAWRNVGAQIFLPDILTLLAESYAAMGRIEEGLALLAEAEQHAQKHSEGYCLSEVYRLKGQSLLQASPHNQADAEAAFQRGLEIARHQGARLLELRAAISFARLQKTEEARQRLAEIYHWFTEGFGTADLKEAQALLKCEPSLA